MIFEVEKIENEILEEIEDKVSIFSEMSKEQRKFLNGLIRKFKPKKVLEVGVSSGASSVIILNAIKDIENSQLYSVDYSSTWYRDNTKPSGFLVEEHYSYLMNKWKFYTGATSARFIEEIGNDIDLVLLDTMHCNPGEFLDYLIVLPFLKKNAIVVIHDLILHTSNFNGFDYSFSTTNCILFSAIKGEKILLTKDNHVYKKEIHYSNAKLIDISGIPNIGAIILDNNAMNFAQDIFMLLSLPWYYMITSDDYLDILNIFIKYYPEKLVNIFERIYLFNMNKQSQESNNENGIINYNYSDIKNKYNIIDYIFSIEELEKYKIIRLFGIKITLKKGN